MFNRKNLYITGFVMIGLLMPISLTRASSEIAETSGNQQIQSNVGAAPSAGSSDPATAGPGIQPSPQSVTQMTRQTSQEPSPAFPSDPNSYQGNDISKRVAEINERMALLSAELGELELKAKIAAKLSEIDNIGKKEKTGTLNLSNGDNFLNPLPGAAPTGFTSKSDIQMPSLSTSTMPVIKSIEGIDGHLKALIEVRGKGTRTVHVGDEISGWKVRSIRVDGVTIEKDKKTQQLYFSSSNSQMTTSMSGTLPSSGTTGPVSGFPSSMGIEPLTYRD